MKIQLEDSEMIYVTNLLNSIVANTKSILETHKRVLSLVAKFEPPRSYVELNTFERTNVNTILTSGLKAVEGQKLNPDLTDDQKDHITRVEALLGAVIKKIGAEVSDANS